MDATLVNSDEGGCEQSANAVFGGDIACDPSPMDTLWSAHAEYLQDATGAARRDAPGIVSKGAWCSQICPGGARGIFSSEATNATQLSAGRGARSPIVVGAQTRRG